MTKSNRETSLNTLAIHAGVEHAQGSGAVATPIFQSSTFLTDPESTSYEDVRYIRLNNTPNHMVLHAKLASLEGGERALVTSSGMAAISTTLMTLLSAGDHVLATDCLYGGTLAVMREELADFGVEVTFVDGDIAGTELAKLVRPNTRALWVEPMSNPTLRVPRLDVLRDFAREHGLISVVDNTFCSPVNFQPLAFGFDLCVHSATKYLNGHSDIVAGAVIGGDGLVGKIAKRLGHLGGTLDPHAAFLLERGLKTLPLRVAQQNKNALAIAQLLEEHPRVNTVHYPGLESHPSHGSAREWFEGFGGVLSFELDGGQEAALRFIQRLEFFFFAPSLGGTESLITLPSRTSHATIPAEERQKLGITDGLIRIAVGIEGTSDLLADISSALEV